MYSTTRILKAKVSVVKKQVLLHLESGEQVLERLFSTKNIRPIEHMLGVIS